MTALSPDLVLRDHTRIGSAPLTPELRFHLADPQSDLWRQEEEALIAQGLPSPFWAFAWGGGQALARLVLDQPERVKDKRVLDFACGCGVAGIAAAKAGADLVTGTEIDAFAVHAARANARLNDVPMQVLHADLVGCDDGWDVVLAGDVFYETEAGAAITDWLESLHDRGALVLIGDPGRAYLPKDKLSIMTRFEAPRAGDLEDQDVGAARVWRFSAPSRGLPELED
ncbi:MAG: nicotinamide N-methylase [Oceanicaulis sp.]|uniref:class I SAM-dependent methyltransferase n=1 Tax=Oceanicaulis sp. UBA6590 TaxID=1947008 RepID=UPI000C500374|nr:50S ribosomal protein L11 methyltransferase [Oceanicaulis sp. UBA6590]MAB70088.1 nicotinamide N-methylase [Oceanicaulis sp.]MBG35827.1 nicotinamide N-methylase [Oceanicaulis sp.]HBU62236.1 nicotinamide N-methylase [Oceanicaulis sp.]